MTPPPARCAWSNQKPRVNEVLETLHLHEKIYNVLPQYKQKLQQHLEHQKHYEIFLEYLLAIFLVLSSFGFAFNSSELMKLGLMMLWLLVLVFPWAVPLEWWGIAANIWLTRALAIIAMLAILLLI